jgi:dTDP-4-dehydrorhamnose 3,5-epimerase
VKVRPTELPAVRVVEPEVFGDARGQFFEAYRASRYAAAGLDAVFVQDNVSLSRRGVLRGLHLQHPRGQVKLVSVLSGEVFDVAVDVRVGSPSFGRWTAERLSSHNHHELWIPPGFAHGFCALSEVAIVAYKSTRYYAPAAELSIRWSDPRIGIAWPIETPLLSDKDARAPLLAELPRERLPHIGVGG